MQSGDSGLLLDLGVCGVWQPQVGALFDIDTPSYSKHTPESVLYTNEWLRNIRGILFTPLVTSVD